MTTTLVEAMAALEAKGDERTRSTYLGRDALPAPRVRLGPDAAALPSPVLYSPQQPRPLARRAGPRIRKGVGETKHWGFNLRSSGALALRSGEDVPYFKRRYYMRGPLVEKDSRPFLLEDVEGAAPPARNRDNGTAGP